MKNLSNSDIRQKILEQKILEEAYYFVDTKSTIRKTANNFGTSKSTVHKHLKENLKHIDTELYNEVALTLQNNLNNRHLRGGKATSIKYEKIRSIRKLNK